MEAVYWYNFLPRDGDDASAFYPIPLVESFLDKGDFVFAKNKGPYAFRKNWLGRILMDVREQLRDESKR